MISYPIIYLSGLVGTGCCETTSVCSLTICEVTVYDKGITSWYRLSRYGREIRELPHCPFGLSSPIPLSATLFWSFFTSGITDDYMKSPMAPAIVEYTLSEDVPYRFVVQLFSVSSPKFNGKNY